MSKCLDINGILESTYPRIFSFLELSITFRHLLLTRGVISRSSDWLLRAKPGTHSLVKLKDKRKGMLRGLQTPAQRFFILQRDAPCS